VLRKIRTLSPLPIEAAPGGGERYTTRGSFTSMGGRWNIEVILRRQLRRSATNRN
jgi:hypothetical protein